MWKFFTSFFGSGSDKKEEPEMTTGSNEPVELGQVELPDDGTLPAPEPVVGSDEGDSASDAADTTVDAPADQAAEETVDPTAPRKREKAIPVAGAGDTAPPSDQPAAGLRIVTSEDDHDADANTTSESVSAAPEGGESSDAVKAALAAARARKAAAANDAGELAKAQGEIQRLQADLDSERNNAADVGRAKAEAEAELAKFRGDADAECRSLRAELQAASEARDAAIASRDAAKDEATAAASRAEQYKAAAEEANRRIAAHEQRAANLNASIDTLQGELRDAREDLRKTSAHRDELLDFVQNEV